ncbi:hypothetical protein DHOM_07335 [Dermabacter hominis 1368]|uniref:Transposase n=1 Tax=Dermabacter hominis 1368 TaxID=1450519 RepID=A0ABR4SKJ0_9MICO|nr:hypothetical protein DHOM_07335 [Dermabacter hominis 1368]
METLTGWVERREAGRQRNVAHESFEGLLGLRGGVPSQGHDLTSGNEVNVSLVLEGRRVGQSFSRPSVECSNAKAERSISTISGLTDRM